MLQTDLRPHQIFYLEQGNSRLYGELIQWVAERNLCWLRPIALCFASEGDVEGDVDSVCDLSQGADLICPDSLLRPALDTEVLSVLTQIHSLKPELAPPPNAHHLRQFVQQLWQTEPEAFQRTL